MLKFSIFFSVACFSLILLKTKDTVAASSADGPSHNVIWGVRGPRDVLLKREYLTEKAKVLRTVSTDYEFRQSLDRFSHPRTITQIVVTDQYTNGDGGYATLKSGGPNMEHAVIHLKSQRGHGFKFVIDIFGQ